MSMTTEQIAKVTSEFPIRLMALIERKGAHFEQTLKQFKTRLRGRERIISEICEEVCACDCDICMTICADRIGILDSTPDSPADPDEDSSFD